MSGGVRGIDTNQDGVHEKLPELVKRYLETQNKRPIQAHTEEAFKETCTWLDGWQGDIVLDSCCGVGESTAVLAARHPQAKVIGLDKSAHRLAKHQHYGDTHDNYRVVRADVNDFWRLVARDKWRVSHHYLLYPNPYPKSSQVQKRWHGSAAFADLLKIGGQLEVRSNWKLYIEEFAAALGVAGNVASAEAYSADNPMTPFERKYWGSTLR